MNREEAIKAFRKHWEEIASGKMPYLKDTAYLRAEAKKSPRFYIRNSCFLCEFLYRQGTDCSIIPCVISWSDFATKLSCLDSSSLYHQWATLAAEVKLALHHNVRPPTGTIPKLRKLALEISNLPERKED